MDLDGRGSGGGVEGGEIIIRIYHVKNVFNKILKRIKRKNLLLHRCSHCSCDCQSPLPPPSLPVTSAHTCTLSDGSAPCLSAG